jgi:hypothetical protein
MNRADAMIRTYLETGSLRACMQEASRGGGHTHPRIGMLVLHTGGHEGSRAHPDDFRELYGVEEEMLGEGLRSAIKSAVARIKPMLTPSSAEKPISKHFGTFGVATSAKSEKGQSKGWLNGVLYLAPHRTGGGPDLCPHSSPGCRAVCLFNSGRIGMSKGRAQIARTQDYLSNRRGFEERLHNDISRAHEFAKSKDYKLAVRLNGTSDIPFHKHGIFERHPEVQFYDYTKDHEAVHKYLNGEMPHNYHLTYSLDETPQSWARAHNILNRGGHVAVPFDISKKEALPETWYGRKVLNGDESDLRFLDPKARAGGGMWVGLHAKQRTSGGPAPHDFGFLVKDPHLNP